MVVPAVSARRTARSAGTRAVGSGGRDATRRASATRQSSRAVTMRPSHASRRAVTLESRASRSAPTSSRASSSRLTVEAPATTERISRSGASRPAAAQGHGPVLPGGQAHPGLQFFGHGEKRLGRHLGPALGTGPRVLLVDGLADGGDPAAQQLLGHGDLFRAQRRQGGVAVGGHRLGPPGPLAPLRPVVAVALSASGRPPARGGSGTAGSLVAIAALGTSGIPDPGSGACAPAFGVGRRRRRQPDLSSRPPPRTGRRRSAGTAPRPAPDHRVRNVVAVVRGRRRPGGRRLPGTSVHRDAVDLVPARSDHLDPLDAAAVVLLGPGGLDGDDGDPFELEVGLRPQDVADLGHGGDKTAVERAPGLPGPRGAPGPRSVARDGWSARYRFCETSERPRYRRQWLFENKVTSRVPVRRR